MKVHEVMHKGVQSVSPDTPIVTIAKTMRTMDIGAIPVGADGKLVGMITDRDITVRAVANERDISDLSARDVMTENVISCRDNEDVDDAVRLMESRRIRRLPVLDDRERMVGMLSIGDISHAASRDLAAEVMKAVSAHHD